MIAIALDGFMRTHAKVPIPHAQKMFSFLTRTFPTAVLANGSVDEAERWLATRFTKEYVTLLGDEVVTRQGETLRQAQVSELRTQGPLELVIDPDPSTVAWLISTGTPALLYASPTYSRPEFRPDNDRRRTWDEIQAELDRQESLLVADPRLRASDGSERLE